MTRKAHPAIFFLEDWTPGPLVGGGGPNLNLEFSVLRRNSARQSLPRLPNFSLE